MMKKTAFIFLLIFFFSPGAFAVNTDEYLEKGLEASGAYELVEMLSEETEEYMKKIGFDEIRFENMLESSPESIFSLIADLLKNGFQKPVTGALGAIGAIMLVSVCNGFFPENENSKSILNIISGSFVVISVFVPAWESIKAAVSAIETCAVFEKALIPVLATIVTFSGNPALALSVKGAAFAAAQTVESIADNLILPLTGISGALGITGSFLPAVRLSAVSDLIRKTLTIVLSGSAALFTAFLNMKSIVSASVDNMAAKGVKFVTSSFVPIIGGAVSEAYSSVLGSLSVVRSTVGIYGIAVMVLTALPVLINLALWIVAMRFACAVSDLLDCRQCSEILKNIAFVFSTVNTILLLCVVVFVITIGLMVTIKSGD